MPVCRARWGTAASRGFPALSRSPHGPAPPQPRSLRPSQAVSHCSKSIIVTLSTLGEFLAGSAGIFSVFLGGWQWGRKSAVRPSQAHPGAADRMYYPFGLAERIKNVASGLDIQKMKLILAFSFILHTQQCLDLIFMYNSPRIAILPFKNKLLDCSWKVVSTP